MAVAVAVALLGVACTTANATAKREADSLASVIEAYRRTDGPGKAARARSVSEVACTDARVCDVKAVCVAAIDSTMQALALKDEVAARVADIEHGTLARDAPEAQALPGKLDQAEKLLKDARQKMGECDDKLANLRVGLGG